MRSPRSGAEVPTGAHPGNTGGKPGRSGRKPAEWTVFCGEVLRDPRTRTAIRRAAKDPKSRGFAQLLKLLAEDAGVKAPSPHRLDQVGRVELVLVDEGPTPQQAGHRA